MGRPSLGWDRCATRVTSLRTLLPPEPGGALLAHYLGPCRWSGLQGVGVVATWVVTPALFFRLKQHRLCCRAGRPLWCHAWPSCWDSWGSACLATAPANSRCTASRRLTSLDEEDGENTHPHKNASSKDFSQDLPKTLNYNLIYTLTFNDLPYLILRITLLLPLFQQFEGKPHNVIWHFEKQKVHNSPFNNDLLS